MECARCRALSLQRVDDPKCPTRVSRKLVRVDLVWGDVAHIFAVMILAGVVVDLVQLTVERGRGMGSATHANFANHIAEPFIRLEASRMSGTASF
jgi:hypothetical protein